jgi:hypothetical protein
MDMQAKTQVEALPVQVRVVLDAFSNGNLPAGQLCDALSRAWALETPRLAPSTVPASTQRHVAVH